MSKQTVLLLGATGETGSDILNGLLEDGSFEVTCLIQPSSASKPSTQALADRGIKTIIADLSGNISDLAAAIKGYSTVISAIGASGQAAQLSLVDAAALAGTQRFVPCGFTVVCPPGGILALRDVKETVYQRVWHHHLPYTIIDVGFWHQIVWPRLPSGKIDYAAMRPLNEVFGSGDVKTLQTDKRDIGRFVARIIKDERTLNKKVFTWSDLISQNELIDILERKSGEKIEITRLAEDEVLRRLDEARKIAEANPGNFKLTLNRAAIEYNVSKYIRGDNTPEVAKYLGYLDARELYPDFKPIKFESYADELLAGKAERPYAGRY